jgi:hypothetical protein
MCNSNLSDSRLEFLLTRIAPADKPAMRALIRKCIRPDAALRHRLCFDPRYRAVFNAIMAELAQPAAPTFPPAHW